MYCKFVVLRLRSFATLDVIIGGIAKCTTLNFTLLSVFVDIQCASHCAIATANATRLPLLVYTRV
jgi:hypothetical protein